MSIPLDRLYQYIESVAQNVSGGNVLIYRFAPHGSKKLEDMQPIKNMNWVDCVITPVIYCYDQEPLDYDYYQNISSVSNEDYFLQHNRVQPRNIKCGPLNVYDKCILLHSELNSPEVTKYRNDEFIPVYYWSHAIMSLDWFRYAQYVVPPKVNQKLKTFLIYNRAWSGTREYRLKFMDLLIDYNLIEKCQTSCNSIEPELQIHYLQHQYINPMWKPANILENYATPTPATSCSSADFDLGDYNQTEFEVVLETLFDDPRVQLTEKVLRPIACKQPFLLLSPAGSLKYLKKYGFKTFDGIIDEQYDTISDAKERMLAVVRSMSNIVNWTPIERQQNMIKIQEITEYNQRHFFSQDFFNLVTAELAQNLKNGLDELEQTNTGNGYLSSRKELAKNSLCAQLLTQPVANRTRQNIASVVSIARTYYNRYLKTLNK